jgi:lipoprotein NlpD
MLTRMHRFSVLAGVAGMSLLLAGCGTLRSSVVVEPAPAVHDGASTPGSAVARTPVPGGSYVVQKGDTLYSIAFRNGVDFRDLAQWNQVAEPYTIWPGQTLMLSPPRHGPATTVASRPAPTSTPAQAPASGSAVVGAKQTPAPVAGAPVFQPVEPAAAGSATPAANAVASTGTASTPATTRPASAGVTAASHPTPAASAGVVPVAGVPAPTPAAVPPPAPPATVPPAVSRAVSGLVWRWPADGSVGRRFKRDDAIPGIEIVGKSGAPVRSAADGVVVYSGNGLVGYGELVIVKHSDSLLSAYGHNRKRLVKEGQRVTAGQQIAEMGSSGGAAQAGLEFQIRKDGNPVDPLAYLPPR